MNATLPLWQRGMVCNVTDKPSTTQTPQTVEQARKGVEVAKAKEKEAIEKQKQQEMFTTAMDKGRDADEATKCALKYKPNSTQGKKAHHAAAVAHKDAHKHFTGVGGEKGGLEYQQRAAAERKAAKHKKLAETHQAMADGFGASGQPPTKNSLLTGHGGTVCNVSNAVHEDSMQRGARIHSLRASLGLARSTASRDPHAYHSGGPKSEAEVREHGSAVAHQKSIHAEAASATAFRTGSARDHRNAAASHEEAAQLHRQAGAAYGKSSGLGQGAQHKDKAAFHSREASAHRAAASGMRE